VTVVSRDPRATTSLHDVRSIGVAAAPLALAGHRSLVIGGGGLFGRHMGRLGRLLPAFGSLASVGRRVIVTGIGLDHDLPPSSRRAVAGLLRRADSVTVRDLESSRISATWGVPAVVAPDLSAHMAASPPEVGTRLLREAGVEPGRPVVGLALTDVERGLTDAILRVTESAMTQLPDVDFCFFPMSRHPSVGHHDDRQLAERLRARQPRLHVLESEHPADVLSAYARLSAAVVMRYHGLLFAERGNVPIVPIPYAEKCEHWLAERGIPAVAPTGVAFVGALTAALATPVRSVAP
jgi:polysaccharide pyruvyl transferase WcaK-like protein